MTKETSVKNRAVLVYAAALGHQPLWDLDKNPYRVRPHLQFIYNSLVHLRDLLQAYLTSNSLIKPKLQARGRSTSQTRKFPLAEMCSSPPTPNSTINTIQSPPSLKQLRCPVCSPESEALTPSLAPLRATSRHILPRDYCLLPAFL